MSADASSGNDSPDQSSEVKTSTTDGNVAKETNHHLTPKFKIPKLSGFKLKNPAAKFYENKAYENNEELDDKISDISSDLEEDVAATLS